MLNTIEMQQTVAQLQAMEKIQQVQQQHGDMQQRHFAAQFSEERRRLKEKVKDADETDFRRLQERKEGDGFEGGRGSGKRRLSAGNPPEERSDDAEADEGSRVDIRV